MGRGRQKAKQAKVARRLKYQSYEPDLEALERELTGQEDLPEYDPYAQYADLADRYADYEAPDPQEPGQSHRPKRPD